MIAFVLLVGACEESPSNRPCTKDEQCTLPQRCSADGLCVAPQGAEDGTPCAHDDHCINRCLDLGEGPKCSGTCDASSGCADDTICRPVAAKPVATPDQPVLLLVCRAPDAPGGERYLGEACSGDAQCRSALCHDDQCAAPCGSCPALTRCQAATIEREGLSLAHDLCVPQPLWSATELGAVPTPATGAAELTFELEGGPGAFLVVAEDDDGNRVAIRRLEAPDGTLLIDTDAPDNALMRGAPYVGLGTALVPGTDDAAAAAMPGSYKLLVGTFDPNDFSKLAPVDGEIERVTIHRRWPGQRGGLIDLNLHFAPGTGITAAGAGIDDFVKQSLARANGLLRDLFGVSIAEVSYFDLTADEDKVESGNEARKVARSFSRPGPNGNAINLFIVQSLSIDGNAIGGFAGTIGTPGLFGSNGSGITLRKEGSAATMGALMAHEIGHWFGLWHTTEANGGSDPIGDTPVCPGQTNTSDCPDYRDVMFPFFAPSGALTLSEGQALVARGSPLQYHRIYPDVCGPAVEGIDASRHGFASGSTAIPASSGQQGSCGGASTNERVQLYRLASKTQKLTITALAHGFDPVVHVRRESCTEASAEVACMAGQDGEALTVEIDNAEPGAYYVFVDSEAGGGRYAVSIRTSQ